MSSDDLLTLPQAAENLPVPDSALEDAQLQELARVLQQIQHDDDVELNRIAFEDDVPDDDGVYVYTYYLCDAGDWPEPLYRSSDRAAIDAKHEAITHLIEIGESYDVINAQVDALVTERDALALTPDLPFAIYHGYTTNARQRAGEHRKKAPWASWVESVRYRPCRSARVARKLETRLQRMVPSLCHASGITRTYHGEDWSERDHPSNHVTGTCRLPGGCCSPEYIAELVDKARDFQNSTWR
ncbi:MAG: hypothetical protein ACRDRJ_28510 [Streptosporangiaceae bacterium]